MLLDENLNWKTYINCLQKNIEKYSNPIQILNIKCTKQLYLSPYLNYSYYFNYGQVLQKPI